MTEQEKIEYECAKDGLDEEYKKQHEACVVDCACIFKYWKSHAKNFSPDGEITSEILLSAIKNAYECGRKSVILKHNEL